MAIVPTAADVRDWAEELQAFERRLAPRFSRREPRERTAAYLRGLLSAVERKNGWRVAESAGDEPPYGVQNLRGRADWDADWICDDLVAHMQDHLTALLRRSVRPCNAPPCGQTGRMGQQSTQTPNTNPTLNAFSTRFQRHVQA